METYLIVSGLIIIVPITYLILERRKLKKQIKEIHLTRRIKAEDIRMIKKEVVPRRVHTLDSTKRMTLQPGNKGIVPVGWESIESKKGDILVDIVPTPKGIALYKFYGSALCMRDKVLIHGLNKKMHKLEITENNDLYIDNEVYKIHIDDIKMLKRYIQEAQGQ